MKLSRSVLSLLTVLLIFAGLAAGVGWRLLAEGDEDSNARPELPDTEGVQVQSAAQFAGAQPVQGAEVLRDTLWIPVHATGEARAYRRSEVATRTSGVVEQVLVRENAVVQQGDLLVQLDTTEAAMELEQALSQHLTATIDFQTRMLAGDADLSFLTDEERADRERRVRALSGLNAAEVNLEQARRQMEFARVRAPFTGRVADLQAVEGAFLNAGAEVLTLLELDPIKIEAEVMESDVAHLNAGRRATIRFASFPGEDFEARVESVNPIIDTDARSARVTLVMPNPGHRIRHGMHARAIIDARAYPDRVLVPREAILERQRGARNENMVFMASNLNEQGQGIAEWRYVTMGFRNETHVEILVADDTDVLEPGEIVLVDGHHYLAHDVEIQLVEDVRAAGGRPGG